MTTENSGNTAGADDLDLFEAEATGEPVSKSQPASKYEGKTVEDLIKMHQNAERKISEQGHEVSALRKMSDRLLDLSKPTTQTTEKVQEHKPLTVEALLNDPEKAIRNVTDTSDIAQRAAQAEARVAKLEAKITERDFVSKHASYAEDMQDPEFTSWIAKNPVRAALGQAASQQNFEAATSLWDMWQEHKELAAGVVNRDDETTSTTKAKPKVPSTVKQSPVGTGGGGKIWSRVKLMELRNKVQDGDTNALTRWNDKTFQDSMHKAYVDGRVR